MFNISSSKHFQYVKIKTSENKKDKDTNMNVTNKISLKEELLLRLVYKKFKSGKWNLFTKIYKWEVDLEISF